jgi:cell filamentation protein
MRELAAENWLEGLAVEPFARRMAYYMGELNVLHPFREGNGRTLREYVRHLAERAGHTISWEGVSSREMVDASIAAYHGRYQLLENLLLRQLLAGLAED